MSKVEIIKRPINGSKKDLKKSAWISVAESIALIVFGVLLATWPDLIIKILALVIGFFFVIKGGYKILNYLIQKENQQDYFNNDLLYGIILALIGITILVLGEGIASIFRIIIGIWMIYESLVRLNTATKLSSLDIPAWRYVLLVAIVMLVLGIFVTFNSGAVVTIIGWIMVATGIIGVVGDAIFIQYVNILAEKIAQKNHE